MSSICVLRYTSTTTGRPVERWYTTMEKGEQRLRELARHHKAVHLTCLLLKVPGLGSLGKGSPEGIACFVLNKFQRPGGQARYIQRRLDDPGTEHGHELLRVVRVVASYEKERAAITREPDVPCDDSARCASSLENLPPAECDCNGMPFLCSYCVDEDSP